MYHGHTLVRLQMTDELMERIDKWYATSSLPETPDKAALEQMLVAMRKQLYR